ncbi:undifferentiated embryonic cell transcription factor 1 isoform X2 [Cricetulus griseus]|uniref:Undifferentiated embryonic cell transcription factor 1 n=1 Tax=Cricetulus griseus TaxID=10029 RepID=A0A8C2L7Z1_CRIGR|nr:undifferentiated embryonic cell transcription factor 1 isoform X2 [Cricetulus griseus]ERE77987.1 undifferentiated embryonic cell transcription factor 1 [Cricetulus griseus]
MLLRPRRLPQFSPPSPASPDAELRPSGDVQVTTSDAFAPTPGAMAEPGSPKAPVSPGSAQRTPWSARETELLLGTLLQPAMWRSLLLDRRQALPTYRRVSAALARQQVRRTPAQCRRRYKFLKDKLRDSHGQPSGPYDDQIRQLMGLLGDDGHQRVRRRLTGPGRPQRRGRSTLAVLTPAPTSVEPGATLPLAAGAADPASALRYSSSTTKSADAHRITSSPTSRALGTLTPEPGRAALGSSPPSTLEYDTEDPNEPPSLPQDRAPPQVASQSLNTALLQALTHLGDISSVLGPLRDQLATLNQHVEHLRGSFDQTVSLAVGFILGSAASERGILGDLRQ